MKRAILSASVVVAWFNTLAVAADVPLWLAVTTESLAPSIQPLAERRRTEGLEAVIFIGDPAAALRKYPKPTYLLLVGDAPAPGEEADAAWHVPAIEMPQYRWHEGQRETFASDSKWGELDGDDLPDVAVGRIPARTPEEAAAVINKIVAYEDRPWTVDDLRFPMWLGAPNYGPAVDAVASLMAIKVAQSTIPRWGEPSLIASLEASPFCGVPAEHAATFHRWLRRGGLVALVGAHGGETYFYSMTADDQWCGYQCDDVTSELAEGPPACPMVVLSCLTGNFAAPQHCLTETLIFAPGGPVAVAGATAESHGLANSLHGMAMVRGLDAAPPRLGDLWLAGLRASRSERHAVLEAVLPYVEGSLEPEIDQRQLRRDQVWMYALLGDPATRFRLPKKLTASLERAGDKWRWRVDRPPAATELQVSVRAAAALPTFPEKLDRDGARALQEQANAIFTFAPHDTLPENAPWEGELSEPGEIRLVAIGPDAWWAAVLRTAE